MARFIYIFRIVILLLCAVAEIPVAFIMEFNPGMFSLSGPSSLEQLAHAFGVGAFAIGVLSILLIFYRTRAALIVGLTTLMIYNAGIGITEGILNYKGPQITTMAFHGVMTLSLLFLLLHAIRQKD